MLTFLSLLPTVILMLLAQWGRKVHALAIFLYILLALINALLLLFGLIFLALPTSIPWPADNGVSFSPADLHFMGRTLIVTALGATLFLLPPVRKFVGFFTHMRAEDPVHVYALVLAVYAIGITLSQRPLLSLLENVEGFALTPAELVGQAAALILLAFTGVGLGIHRSLRATLQRLGLAWLGRRELISALIATVILLFLQGLISAIWMKLSPQSMEAVEKLSETLLGPFFTPLGAIMIGLIAGISEELVFRGALQPRLGLLLTSAVFAFVHVQYAMTLALLIVFLLGLVLGILRNRVNTTAAILTHTLYNTGVVLLAIYAPQMGP